MEKLNKKMVLASLIFIFAIGTFSIVSCNKEEPATIQNETIIKKSASGGYDFPDGKYSIFVNGDEFILFISNGGIEKITDGSTGEIINPDKINYKTFPGTSAGEKEAMEFVGAINDGYDCITMKKSGVYENGKEIGWCWVVTYGCD